MSHETYQGNRTSYDSLAYQEISAEEYIFLREKNPESICDSHIIPPALGSSGFGKILVDLNYIKAGFKIDHSTDRTEAESIDKHKPLLNVQIKKFEILLMYLIWQILIKK